MSTRLKQNVVFIYDFFKLSKAAWKFANECTNYSKNVFGENVKLYGGKNEITNVKFMYINYDYKSYVCSSKTKTYRVCLWQAVKSTPNNNESLLKHKWKDSGDKNIKINMYNTRKKLLPELPEKQLNVRSSFKLIVCIINDFIQSKYDPSLQGKDISTTKFNLF